MHSEVIVLLLGDPLERDPPRAPLPFATPMHRVELDLGVAAQRQRWRQEFVAPVDAALATLPPRGVRVHVRSSDAPSQQWLDRTSVAEGKRVSVRVEPGGLRSLKTIQKHN